MDSLIDDHVSTKQADLAVSALLDYIKKVHAKKDEQELLGATEEHIWLVLATKRMHPEKKLKPFKIPLAHPLVDPRTTPICLLVKDPQREYKDLLAAQNIKFISRVVGVEKLKGKFKPFDARRELLRDHGLFLADERIVPLLPTLLGKMFFDAKKQPIPVSLTKKDVKSELERAVSATYMHQNKGTCTSIKIATTSHKAAHILANLVTALPEIVAHTPEGWENVQSIHIKTSQSVSLPIWSCDLGAGPNARWPVADAATAEEDGDTTGSSEPPEPPAPKKGKKRSAASTEEDVDAVVTSPAPPSKKTKVSKPLVEVDPSTVELPATPLKKASKKSKTVSTPVVAAAAPPSPVKPVAAPVPAPAPAPTPEVEASPAADSATPSKQTKRRRNRKAAAAAATNEAASEATPVVEKAIVVAVPDATPSSNKPTKKSKKATSTPAAATTTKVVEPTATPIVVDAAETTPSKASLKRRKKAATAAAATVLVPSTNVTDDIVTDPTPKAKTKPSKEVEPKVVEPAASTLSVAEVQGKRAPGLEKRKEKVIKGKGKGMGRGVKGAVIGKSSAA